MVFPVVMYGCESWTIKKAEHQRIDAFELWCWRRLESPLDSKDIKPVNPKGNQPWIFTGRTDVEAVAPILWPPDEKSWLIRTLMLGKTEGRRRRGQQRMRWFNGITNSMDMSLQAPGVCVGQGSLASAIHGAKSWTQLSDWTDWTPSRLIQLLKWKLFILLHGWVIVHCIYVFHIFIIHLTMNNNLDCLHSLAYCEQCYNECECIYHL